MSRESILKAVKNNKPEALALPEIDLAVFYEDINTLETFTKNVEAVGGRAVVLSNVSELDTQIKHYYPKAVKVVSCTKLSHLGSVPISKNTNPHSLQDIDLAIIQGQFGVAENGAVWIEEKGTLLRVLPFITNDLVIIVPKDNIYLNLHNAYNEIRERERSFGLFLSGPSKTADIEQCLVIGAHGAVSLTVFVV
ncbi:MAG: lactate utilization protein C [Flavobacteriaceae bacterium]